MKVQFMTTLNLNPQSVCPVTAHRLSSLSEPLENGPVAASFSGFEKLKLRLLLGH
jgi:hypothetical protein